MKPFKARTIDPLRAVRVYRNLQRNTFSVVQDGLVKAHMDQLCLKDVTPVVSLAGRERVVKEGRKNVHAYLRGLIDDAPKPSVCVELTYNPYKSCSFYLKGEKG
jgi:hypothetical protein